MTKKFLLIFATALLFTSCVSKKKFVEMQNGRLKAEELVRRLNKENIDKAERIKVLIKDFEVMKNELMESNAIKDYYIDSLTSEVYVLKEHVNIQKESLQASSFNLDFEKQRLTEAIKSKDNTIRSLQSKTEQLESTLSAKNSFIDQKNFDLNRMENQVNVLQGKLNTGETQITKLNSQLELVKSEVEKLQSQIKEKDAAILKLQNNVKLLKKELGQ